MGNLTLRTLPGLARKPGRHPDGQGLSLRVLDPERRYWSYRYRLNRKESEFSLGPYPEISLDEARRLHAAARAQVKNGIDPLAAKRARKAAAAAPPVDPAAPKPTFGQIADDYIATHEASWRNAKHRQQWRNTLRDYAASIRDTPVDKIDTEAVVAVLKPIWSTKADTAGRVRSRIETVLDAARVLKHIGQNEANPARWKGHLAKLLPKPKKLVRGHHAAMPYADLPAFMARLREAPGVAAKALAFAILTAARSGEVLGARWDEIDLDAAIWCVPPQRMKANKLHRVPLSSAALGILGEMLAARKGDHSYVFPGQKRRRPLSNMALEMTLRRLGADEFTPHGMRSAFRDWATEVARADYDVAERALAHAVGSGAARAYDRSDRLDLRRALMQTWAAYLSGKQTDESNGEESAGEGMMATA
jgi:integrase